MTSGSFSLTIWGKKFEGVLMIADKPNTILRNSKSFLKSFMNVNHALKTSKVLCEDSNHPNVIYGL